MLSLDKYWGSHFFYCCVFSVCMSVCRSHWNCHVKNFEILEFQFDPPLKNSKNIIFRILEFPKKKIKNSRISYLPPLILYKKYYFIFNPPLNLLEFYSYKKVGIKGHEYEYKIPKVF